MIHFENLLEARKKQLANNKENIDIKMPFAPNELTADEDLAAQMDGSSKKVMVLIQEMFTIGAYSFRNRGVDADGKDYIERNIRDV
ncbi:MAG: hypothetical protein Q9174_007430 [Haloplaca sp. 1 TL-2023]